MREFKDGTDNGRAEIPTRVDFRKRERVPEPLTPPGAGIGPRRALEGAVSIDRVVVAPAPPAAAATIATDIAPAGSEHPAEQSAPLDWRHRDRPVPERVGVLPRALASASGCLTGVLSRAVTGAGVVRVTVENRAGVLLTVAGTLVILVGVGVFAIVGGGPSHATKSRADLSAAGINAPAGVPQHQITFTPRPPARAVESPQHRRRRVPNRVRSIRHRVKRAPARVRTATAVTHSTPAPAGTTTTPAASPVQQTTTPQTTTPSPVSTPTVNSAPSHSTSNPPAFGYGGVLGAGHGNGTG